MKKIYFKNLIFFMLIIPVTNITAQVNTEKYRTPADYRGFAYFMEISGTAKTGNAEEIEVDVDGRIDWKSKKTTLFLVFKNEYEWVNGNRVINERLFHLRNVIALNKRFSAEIFAQLNYDKKIRIDRRELIGGGIRYNLHSRDQQNIALGTSYMYEHEKYSLPAEAVHPSETYLSRWSNYLSGVKVIREDVSVSGVMYYQPAFEDFQNYRLLGEISLTLALKKYLAISVDFGIRHDSEPADEVEDTDTTTDFGIVLRF